MKYLSIVGLVRCLIVTIYDMHLYTSRDHQLWHKGLWAFIHRSPIKENYPEIIKNLQAELKPEEGLSNLSCSLILEFRDHVEFKHGMWMSTKRNPIQSSRQKFQEHLEVYADVFEEMVQYLKEAGAVTTH